MKIAFCLSLVLVVVVLLETHEALGSREYDGMRASGSVVGLTRPLTALGTTSRSKRRTPTQPKFTRRCEVVSQVNAFQWWVANICATFSIRPPVHPVSLLTNVDSISKMIN